jgi:trans-2,3-dihydro-3-hydroxyanthranilate isomerase
LVDVFTQGAFGGNPLAVFTDAQGLTPSVMQLIAEDLNLGGQCYLVTFSMRRAIGAGL